MLLTRGFELEVNFMCVYDCYGSTGYGVSSLEIQNWKYFCLKINISTTPIFKIQSFTLGVLIYRQKIFTILYPRNLNSITGIAIMIVVKFVKEIKRFPSCQVAT